jgi:Spy/CpxP family protein refolding chaperone
MSWIRMAIGGAAFVGIASVASAQAQQGGGAQEQGPAKQKQGVAGEPGAAREARMAKRVFAGIDLTEAQNAQVQKIMEKANGEMQALMPAATGGEKPAKPDDATRAKMMEISAKAQAEYRTILTADQQQIFDKNVAEIKARMDKRKQQGKDGG